MQFWSGTPFMKTAEIIAVARMFDDAGYDGLICSAHLIYPRELSSPYPDSSTGRPGWPPETAWPDSWVLTGAMAAVTKRLRFSNAVYVAPARPLIEVAKQVATASVLSEGRVSLGVGVGWMREEYQLMGQDFDTRGKRLNEMIPCAAGAVPRRLGVVERPVLPGAGDDDRTPSRGVVHFVWR
jgi:alkanesulfonate monooxygenase SsuD/methylene tetrahydromethanopterin reductase-like flavin-dependent oxidoreductase (luciferase family)